MAASPAPGGSVQQSPVVVSTRTGLMICRKHGERLTGGMNYCWICLSREADEPDINVEHVSWKAWSGRSE
jgi:hypothetical protein